MYKLKITNAFKKDLKALKKQGKKLEKLNDVIGILIAEKELPAKNRNHLLSGQYTGMYECHIEPDWLLIYLKEDEIITLTLIRTGSHSNLFN